MSRLRIYLLFAVLYTCWDIGHSDTITMPPKPDIIVLKKSAPPTVPEILLSGGEITMTEEQTPPTTTPPPTTTTPVTTTTPHTTTPPPTTTTPATTTSTTTTTTPPPTTPPPTTPPPTPAPAPAPLPPAEKGHWEYTDPKRNLTCILVEFAAQLNVTYTKADAASVAYVVLNVPANASALAGSCNGSDQWVTLNWTAPGTNITNNLTLVYHRNDTTKDYGLKSVNISLSAELFVNASSKDPVELYHGAEWQTPLATSYRCTPPTRVNLTSESPSTVAALTLTNVQEEAFREVPGGGFSAARECGGRDVPDAVPIAVGCGLAALVVMVLIAYVVARRRASSRGYLSM